MLNHIVLYSPRIPANTGNISRTCAATNTPLHLIHPLGFETTDKQLKRAGLDYWKDVEIYHHQSLEDFMTYLGDRTFYLISKFAPKVYTQVDLNKPTLDEQFFIFGNETSGLPEEFMQAHKDRCLRIPMNDTHVRSLNLSNTASIILYEAMRQQHYQGLEATHHYDDTPKARRLNW